MDVIQAARDLGKALQADDRYIRIMAAQEKNDDDTKLQDEISAFNMKRTQLNAEVQKSEKDQDKIKAMDTELKAMYAKIFENPNMIEFSDAKDDMDELIAEVNTIITGSASGQNPDEIVYSPAACGGECGGCSGCH